MSCSLRHLFINIGIFNEIIKERNKKKSEPGTQSRPRERERPLGLSLGGDIPELNDLLFEQGNICVQLCE